MKIETIILVIGVSIIIVGIALAIIYQIPIRIS